MSDEKITIVLETYGVMSVEVSRAEYEQAKADDELADFLDAYASDMEALTEVIETWAGGARFDLC